MFFDILGILTKNFKPRNYYTTDYNPLDNTKNDTLIHMHINIGQIGAVSPTARHCYKVPSELCSPGAKPRRWALPLVTRFGVIGYREYDEDLI